MMSVSSLLLAAAVLLQASDDFVRVAGSANEFKVIPCRPILIGLDGRPTDKPIVVPLVGGNRLVQGFLSLRCDERKLSDAAGELNPKVVSPRAFAVKLFAEDKVVWKRELAGGSTDRIVFSATIDAESAGAKRHGALVAIAPCRIQILPDSLLGSSAWPLDLLQCNHYNGFTENG